MTPISESQAQQSELLQSTQLRRQRYHSKSMCCCKESTGACPISLCLSQSTTLASNAQCATQGSKMLIIYPALTHSFSEKSQIVCLSISIFKHRTPSSRLFQHHFHKTSWPLNFLQPTVRKQHLCAQISSLLEPIFFCLLEYPLTRVTIKLSCNTVCNILETATLSQQISSQYVCLCVCVYMHTEYFFQFTSL